MKQTSRTMLARKHVALVAHDHYKDALSDWVQENKEILSQHELYATGTTGHILARETGLKNNALDERPDGRGSATWGDDF